MRIALCCCAVSNIYKVGVLLATWNEKLAKLGLLSALGKQTFFITFIEYVTCITHSSGHCINRTFLGIPKKTATRVFWQMIVVMKHWPVPIYLNGIGFMGDWKDMYGFPESGQPTSYEIQWKEEKLEIYCSLFAV